MRELRTVHPVINTVNWFILDAFRCDRFRDKDQK